MLARTESYSNRAAICWARDSFFRDEFLMDEKVGALYLVPSVVVESKCVLGCVVALLRSIEACFTRSPSELSESLWRV